MRNQLDSLSLVIIKASSAIIIKTILFLLFRDWIYKCNYARWSSL